MKYLDIFLREEDRMLQEQVRKFVDAEIMPVRQQLDDDEDHVIVHKILQGLFDMGLMLRYFPAEYGGCSDQSTFVSSSIMLEEIARGDSGIAVAFSCVGWAFQPAVLARNRTILERFVPLFTGKEVRLACFNMTEPGGAHGGGGCDIENPTLHGRTIRTIARLEGDEWVINGQKLWATNSGVSDLYCTVCTTDPNAGEKGIALIYIPHPTPGMTFGKFERKAGMNADRNCATYLVDVRVPREYRASEEGKDAELFHLNLVTGRLGGAAMAVGNAQGAFERVLEYTGERIVAGRPIRQHSIAAGMLADMAMAIETARMYYLAAAYMMDNSRRYGGLRSNFILSRVSLAKVYAAEVAVMVTNKAMELMGSYGYVRDYDVEKYWRDCKIIQLWEGGAQLGRFDICRGYYDCQL
ncbi:MAG: acyl-CoA dehydrogenase family protein [Syntrophales bacterium]|nr:acyl-CoA dehydrogenase family protein [Syntrophales bacterium]